MNEIIENMRTTDRIPEGICENNFGKGNGCWDKGVMSQGKYLEGD